VLVLHHPELVASPADEQEEDVKEELEEDVENPDVEDSSWVLEDLEVRVFSQAASSNIATSDIAIGGNCYYHLGY
jgi:hypothetical protein